MKKRYLLLVAALIVIIVYSCLKGKESLTSATTEDSKAIITWLESQKKIFNNDSLWIDSMETSLDFQDQVSLSFDSEQDIFIIPLHLKLEHELHNLIPLNITQTELLIFKDKQGHVMSGKIVGISSSVTYKLDYIVRLQKSMLNVDKIFDNGFTGSLTLLKLNKALVSHSLYNKGKYVSRSNLQSANDLTWIKLPKQMNTDLSVTRPNAHRCTDWYNVTYIIDTGEITDVVWAFTVCADDGTDTGSGGAGTPEGIRDWESGIAGLPDAHLCTGNTYNLAPIGNSYTGQINKLGMSLVGPSGQFLNVEMGNTCISIPSYGISASTASAYFVSAWNNAVNTVMAGLNNGSISPNSTSVKAKLKLFMIGDLQDLAPGSTISTGTGCQGGAPVNTARYC